MSFYGDRLIASIVSPVGLKIVSTALGRPGESWLKNEVLSCCVQGCVDISWSGERDLAISTYIAFPK